MNLTELEQALVLVGAHVSAAYEAHDAWADRIRAGLMALLEFFDDEPALARYCVVHSAQAGPAVLARRCEVLDRLAQVLDHERAPARGYPPPLTAEAVVSGVLGVLYGRLRKPDPGVLAELCNPLMSFIVLPYLGARAARRELSRPAGATATAPECGAALDLLQDPGKRLNHHRTLRVLGIIGADPGLNNRAVARRAGVKDEGHMSRLLSRLERLGLIVNTRDARNRAAAKAWQLTVSGEELEIATRHAPPAPAPAQRRAALDLLGESGARLNHRAVSILTVIGTHPGLSNTGVAVRTDINGKGQASTLLARLARYGLIENTRTGGRENVWQLTARGQQLDTAIREQTPDAGR